MLPLLSIKMLYEPEKNYMYQPQNPSYFYRLSHSTTKSLPFWMKMIPKDNSAYILNRYPYIDGRTIKKANYSNYDERRHVSKLLDRFRCHSSPIKLLVTVMSHSASFTRREAIRKSWGGDGSTDQFKVFFFVANVKEVEVMSKVRKESLTHGDIVMGNFYESFYNNSFKVIASWVGSSYI